MRCAVVNCKQNSSLGKGKYVPLYCFPKDEAQRSRWVMFCNRKDSINPKLERICALHFKKEDFERNLIFEMGFSKRRSPKLKPGAVPTIQTGVISNEINKYISDESNSLISTAIYEGGALKLEPGTISIIETNVVKKEIETFTYDEKNALIFSNTYEDIVPILETGTVATVETRVIANNIETGTSNEHHTPLSTETKIERGVGPKIKTNGIENKNDTLSAREKYTPESDKIYEDAAPIFERKVNEIKIPRCGEEFTHLCVKSLKNKIDELSKENEMLRKYTAIKIQKLSSQVKSLSTTNTNLDNALRKMFSENQIRKLKNGDKRQNFTEADIEQAISLYSTSPKVYKLLKKKHFPLPSVRTLQRWSQTQTGNIPASENKTHKLNNKKIRIRKKTSKKEDFVEFNTFFYVSDA